MSEQIKVLIVDDSAFARSLITKRLEANPQFTVVGVARDGLEAVEQVKALRPDVVTLDVTMPRLDGLGALERIMADCPTPVVMLSAVTGEQTHATIEALELGAVDFFLKPSLASPAGEDGSGPGSDSQDLLSKIKVAASIPKSKLRAGLKAGARKKGGKAPAKPGLPSKTAKMAKVLVIGSSTGGPKALADLIPALPSDLPTGILIVQHMPEGFTKSFAQRLDQTSELEVKEAEAGDVLRAGRILLAPGGYHMKVTDSGEIDLDLAPQECGVRPSLNVTIESVVQVYGSSSLGVVLTGMGHDGARGSALIKAAGGQVAVEDESTCAVYGMPKAVVDAGHADRVVPLPLMAQEIVRMCRVSNTLRAGR